MLIRRLVLMLAALAIASPASAALGFNIVPFRTGFEPWVCPNGAVEDVETCDDGASAPGDGCSPTCSIEFGFYCDGAPSACATLCGDGAPAGDEACDDNGILDGDGCSSQCMVESGFLCVGAPSVCSTLCGDGIIVGAESCDDQNLSNGDGCSAKCAIEPGFQCVGQPSICATTCGDGIIAGAESCDDQNLSNGDGCSAQCAIEPGFQCVGQPSVCAPTCGDGIIAGAESCDDLNTFGGDGCSAQCTVELGFFCVGQPSVCAPTCGDGLVVGGEVCDDGNTDACGTCSADCQMVQSGVASGFVVAVAANQLIDGEGFTIDDGFQAATFEFDFNVATQPGRVAIPLSPADTASQVAGHMRTAINLSPLQVQAASGSSALVQLAHDRATSLGNRPILETVADTGFLVEGMSGGRGGDCPVSVGCVIGADCASGVCNQGVCTMP